MRCASAPYRSVLAPAYNESNSEVLILIRLLRLTALQSVLSAHVATKWMTYAIRSPYLFSTRQLPAFQWKRKDGNCRCIKMKDEIKLFRKRWIRISSLKKKKANYFEFSMQIVRRNRIESKTKFCAREINKCKNKRKKNFSHDITAYKVFR